MPSPTIYAELFTNIRQLSVAVTLPSPAERNTQGTVTSDGATLRLRHAGTQTQFFLPGKVVPPRDGLLPPPHPGSRVLSWRLPLSESSTLSARSLLDEPVPWTATDLVAESAVKCRGCASLVVSEGKAMEWKDLPSENWAEMMDFWHCHKPTDHEHGEEPEHLAKRGYGANSSIAAQNGVGLVDLTSFLFTGADCSGLVFSSSSFEAGSDTSAAVLTGEADPPPRMLYVFCAGCKNHIGFFNVAISSVVLFKWQVSCRTTSNCVPPRSSDCLAATLIATLSRSGSSKSVVVPTFSSSQSMGGADSDTAALHLWILNGNITYASSDCEGKRSAIKLLYKKITQREADSMLESMTSDVQEVNLPTVDIARAAEVLQRSNTLLPVSERTFKEWNVGLLDKWQAGGESSEVGPVQGLGIYCESQS